MPLRFTLRQLEYLIAVADTGSVTLAAERVNVSAPSVSAAIAQLEEGFGLQLFVRRHAQGLSLTEAGRQFVAAARPVLGAAAGLTDRAADIAGRVAGPLGVGCLVTFAQVVLPRLRAEFRDRFPEVEFRQAEHDQAALFEELRAGRLDLALTYDLGLPPDLTFLPLLSLPPHALLPPGHPLAARQTVTMADLAPEPMVLLDLPFSADYFLGLFTARQLRPRVTERTTDMGVMRSMVARGFGYSIANIRLATDLAPDGGRVTCRPIADAAPIRLGLLVAGGAEARRTVRAFIDHCRATVTPSFLPPLAP